MAAVARNAVNSGDQFGNSRPSAQIAETDAKSGQDSKSEFRKNINQLADILSNLNPWAEEFVPSSCRSKDDQPFGSKFPTATKNSEKENSPNYPRKRNNLSQERRNLNGRFLRAQREDSVRRTVYVSDIDQHVTEERLAALFSSCGQVVDCRICGDPRSALHFAFVEFADEHGARSALSLSGIVLGYYPLRVMPSKTAILPVNPTFLPRSNDEREMCARTVYCTNIDKKVSEEDVKNLFESTCGEVSRLRILGDNVHTTHTAFVEFVKKVSVSSISRVKGVIGHNLSVSLDKGMAESAILALNCSGMILGTQPIRVSPSKTPVRPRAPRPSSQ